MPLMQWEERYSVHIANIDDQHKKLFLLINQLHDAMSKGKAEDVMQSVLGELLVYTKTHFAAEEKLMESKNYPGLAPHVAQHRKFVEKLATFQKEFTEHKATLSIGLMTYLRDWLTGHILQTDHQYSDFFAGNQAKSAAHR